MPLGELSIWWQGANHLSVIHIRDQPLEVPLGSDFR